MIMVGPNTDVASGSGGDHGGRPNRSGLCDKVESVHAAVVVVAGGTGVAGECVVAELVARGATVAVPSRSQARLDRLRDAHPQPNLHLFRGGMDSYSAAAKAADAITSELGGVDAVVASLGGWWEGEPLTEISEQTWRSLLDANLTSHFITARTFLPMLASRPGTTYVTLNGVAAQKAVARSGPISVTGAAQQMMLRVLAEEVPAVRLHEVAILTPIITRHWDGSPTKPGWLTGAEVGRYVADVLESDFAYSDELLLAIPSS
jgi:NAD(P)-dependent dehydrogenase (short-subunit alcohol dehydrogenase family)